MKRVSLPRGFTLVESALAIGVMAFAMVSIFGLIPVGLETFRTATNLTVEAAIVQSLSSDLQRTEYADLEEATLYFDHEGAPSGSAQAAYVVHVLPAQDLDASGLVNSTAAKTIPITIASTTAPAAGNSYFVIVAKTR